MNNNNEISVSGVEISPISDNDYDEGYRQKFSIKHKKSVSVADSRADSDMLTIKTDSDDVLLLELQDDIKLIIRHDDFQRDFPDAVVNRSAEGEILFPTEIDFDLSSRSLGNRGVGKVLVRVLSVFGVNKAARISAAALVEKFEDNLDPGPGFYQVKQSESIQLVPAELTSDNDAPMLVFIHGTASSTEGSFGALWSDQKTILQQLFDEYDKNIFALEHRTLSQSPIENALDLVRAIPEGATVHLVSHSRGGIVAELLCRGTVRQGIPSISDEDIELFAAQARKKTDSQKNGSINNKSIAAYMEQLKLLQELGKELDKKRIKVERFVRVACPANGTTLASGRLDRWLSIMLNLIALIPALGQSPLYGLFKNFALALVENKAQPDEIPGLEAQMPDSPLVALLNYSTHKLNADLSVISGDIEKDSVLGRIAMLAPDRFYRGDHDLIVNTASMYGGGIRESGGRFLYVRGSNVHHFSYFRNSRTASAIFTGLVGKEAELENVFGSGLPALDKPIPRSVSSSTDAAKPVVVIVPGIMGSELWNDDECIWADIRRLMWGGLGKLDIDIDGVLPKHIMPKSYARIVDYLKESHDVFTFPYDWRKPLHTQVPLFAKVLKKIHVQQRAKEQPIRILAHSMGGLLTRLLISKNRTLWNDIIQHPGARFIMLGTPNNGSYSIPRMLLGQDKLVKKLALIDLKNSIRELLDIVRKFPGVLELLPDFGSPSLNLFDKSTWDRLAIATGDDWPVPQKAALAKAHQFRTLLNSFPLQNEDREKIVYVAGVAPQTPIGLRVEEGKVIFAATPDGDGRVSWDSGIPANIKTWYMDASHGDMADHPPAFEAIKELLDFAKTDKLATEAPARVRGVQDVFDLKPDEIDMYPDQIDLQTAITGGRDMRFTAEPIVDQIHLLVSHGDLAFARNPVVVGHYLREGQLFSAERALDKCLDEQLSQRLQLNIYPGDIETCAIVLNKPNRKPQGAIVIGLGEVGKLRVSNLSATFSYALRSYGMQLVENSKAAGLDGDTVIDVKISSLLIGGSTAGLPTRDALVALLKGAISANTSLSETYKDLQVRIVELEFIEWYEDEAINLIETLHHFEGFERDIGNHFHIPKIIRKIGGGKRRIRFTEAPGWWQRMQIEQETDGALRFTTLTERARAPVNLLPTDRRKVDQFLASATNSAYDTPEVTHTLFHLLLPNELKDRAAETSNLILILNRHSARYPWELIADKGARDSRPLAITNSVIRQLESKYYRENPKDVTSQHALVIGEPDLQTGSGADDINWSPLPGAREEAKLVIEKLVNSSKPFSVESSINENDFDIITKLHKKPYRVMHFAGHGVFDHIQEADDLPGDPSRGISKANRVSGMVIGKNQFLNPADVNQISNVPELVFINCCHLGNTKEDKRNSVYPSLAANLAVQFIEIGVHAVVAAGWVVNDAAAKTFASTFYDAMLGGQEFGSAVHAAREKTYVDHPGSNTWGAYQCYGDPHYTLCNKKDEKSSPQKTVVTPSALVLELDNICDNAGNFNPVQTQKYRDRMERLQDQSDTNGWSKLGDVCAAFGRAYAELDQFEKAILWYENSLQAEIAKQPIATLEQLANIKIRYAARTLQDSVYSRRDIAAARKEVISGIEILENLLNVVSKNGDSERLLLETSERLALLGSAYKRKAKIDVHYKSGPVSSLKKMRDCYYKSHKIYTEVHPGKTNEYPYLNYLTAKFLLNLLEGSKHKEPENKELRIIGQLESRADEKDAEDPSFWTLSGRADCQLLMHILNKDLNRYVEDIAETYRTAKARSASAREFQSIIEHAEFLRVLIAAAAKVHGGGKGKLSEHINGLKEGIAKLSLALADEK